MSAKVIRKYKIYIKIYTDLIVAWGSDSETGDPAWKKTPIQTLPVTAPTQLNSSSTKGHIGYYSLTPGQFGKFFS